MLSHSMEAATQMNGCEFGAEWHSTSEVSSFPALFSCNSTNSQQKDSWNIGECWRTHDGSALPAGGHGRGPFMSACCLTQLTRPQGQDPQPAGTSSPEVAMTRHVNSLCDPEARLSGCSTIDSQYCFSSFLNSLADSENLQAENFIYSANVRKDIDGIRIYPRQPHELQAYLGTVYPSCDVPPAGSMSAAVLPCISLEQSQGFVCNSADIFPSAVRAPEDILSSTDTQAQAFIADIIHSTTLASASISRGGFPRGDATGSHDNLYSLSNPLAAHNQITNNGQTGETIDRQNRIKEINSGTIIPPTNSSISGDPSAKLTRCKDNLVGQYCSRNQPQRLTNIEVHTPCKRISTDAVGENPPPAKKSALWNSTNQDSPVMGYKSSIPPAKAALMGSSALNTNLRQRTKQGSASDPQSIAARHRRERISERLKILQDLVPNGSKVDLVTMLEKAINYVKFLQLQVKVLTTDEYWPTQDKTSSKIMRVEDALQAIASADAELGHACANNMDCTSATDQTLRV